ncbi:MAG: redox-regulated ATPase YchF [Candidatus Bipolaricaulota bacterium]|nr:redox-regulated ATPase YchF [Candidatus Bipolaricaulota bacterium]
MGLSCGLVGLPRSGKTTIFNAVSAAQAAAFGTELNRAIVTVPDPRVEKLVGLYQPPKVVPATLELVDIPGLEPGSTAADGRGLRLLGHVKEVDVLVYVIRCFEDGSVPADPARDVEAIDLELVVADIQTLTNKIDRLSRRARIGDTVAQSEVAACTKVRTALEGATPVRRQTLSCEEEASLRECNLLSQRPVLFVANVASMADAEGPAARTLRALAEGESAPLVVMAGRDEAEVAELPSEDRPAFLAELGLKESSIERLIRAAYRLLRLTSFFTAGEKEVHVWTCRQGEAAPVAAGKIHSDMEKGFIRMEVIRYDDLVAHQSEAAVAKAGKQRVEGRAYRIQDGDIVVVRFSGR